MKRLIMIFTMFAALMIGGCSGENAKEIFETAQLEELQKNHAHAKELYRKLIQKHPESAYAAKAREKLDALNRAGQ
ncbi:MAG: hypothetical protein K9N21_14785 [Deltaproteobacteria bacterium]|nr:hypothetical protein [Deltaproteobacteria bacterium]